MIKNKKRKYIVKISAIDKDYKESVFSDKLLITWNKDNTNWNWERLE